MFVEPDGMAFPVLQSAQDPWMTADPWGGNATLPIQAAPQQQQSAMQGAWGNQNQQQQQQQQQQPTASPQAFPAQNQWQGESDADTDSNTESSLGEEINYSAPEFTVLTRPQISEKLWWAMARSKSMWRKHMQKPVRKARRFFKRSFPQLRQPKGKGKGRYNAMIQMDDQRYDQVYFGGKGLSKGKRQTTGDNFGRRTNPTGPDGEIMKRTVCDSTEHFRAMCPQTKLQPVQARVS